MTDKTDPLQRFTDVQQEIETALTQPEQKPVVWLSTDSIGEMYLPTPPQKREWQGLTDEEYNRLVMEHLGPHALTGGKMSVYDAFLLAIRATEAKLKEKND